MHPIPTTCFASIVRDTSYLFWNCERKGIDFDALLGGVHRRFHVYSKFMIGNELGSNWERQEISSLY